MDNDMVEIEFDECVASTPAAVLLVNDGDADGGGVWIPRGQIEGVAPDVGHRGISVSIPEWLAIEKELV